jgi:hypothetical protein
MSDVFYDPRLVFKCRNPGYDVASGLGFDLSQCGGFSAACQPPRFSGLVALANASTGICLLELCMDHRINCGGDESESGVTVACHSSGAKTRRENDSVYPLQILRSA